MILEVPPVLVRKLVTVALKSEVSTQSGLSTAGARVIRLLPNGEAAILKLLRLAQQTEADGSPQHEASKNHG